MIKKTDKETVWVLVETIEMFRKRYVVECPIDDPDRAFGIVSAEKAQEFSQKHIGENITSGWIVTEEDALLLCEADNQWGDTWTWKKEPIIKNHFTRMEDIDAIA